MNRIEQHPLYNQDYHGNGSFVRLLVTTEDKKAGTPVFFSVEYRETAGGEWMVPDGWATEFLSGITANFAWSVCPGGAYIQVARWLEMELYINGELSPRKQILLAKMSEQDFMDTFHKDFNATTAHQFKRPYELEDLEARIKKRIPA